MPLSAKDIDELELSTSLRGYDTDEVDDLLDRVAAQIHRTERELGDLRTRLHERDERHANDQATIEQLRAGLAQAQQAAEAARADADTLRTEVEQLRQRVEADELAFQGRLDEQLAQVRNEAERRLADAQARVEAAEARAADAEPEIDRRLGEVHADLERRMDELRQDAERRVGEAWASVDVERAELQRERQRLHEEFDALRRAAAAMHQTLRAHVDDQSGRLDEVAEHLSALEATIDPAGARPHDGASLSPPEQPYGDEQPYGEPEIHDAGHLQVRVYPDVDSDLGDDPS